MSDDWRIVRDIANELLIVLAVLLRRGPRPRHANILDEPQQAIWELGINAILLAVISRSISATISVALLASFLVRVMNVPRITQSRFKCRLLRSALWSLATYIVLRSEITKAFAVTCALTTIHFALAYEVLQEDRAIYRRYVRSRRRMPRRAHNESLASDWYEQETECEDLTEDLVSEHEEHGYDL